MKKSIYFVAIKHPKALLKRTMISCSSQTSIVYYGYKVSGRKKKNPNTCITMNVICKCANGSREDSCISGKGILGLPKNHFYMCPYNVNVLNRAV